MAKASRIETGGVTFNADGSVEVKVTRGDYPLNQNWQGEALLFGSKEDFMAAIADAERVVGDNLHLLQLAVGMKNDPAFKQAFKNRTEGKTVTLDTLGLGNVITGLG